MSNIKFIDHTDYGNYCNVTIDDINAGDLFVDKGKYKSCLNPDVMLDE